MFIAGSNLNQAMHGDRVVARIERISDNRAEGRILRILERGSSTVVGRFDLDGMGLGFVVPFDRRLIMDVSIPPGEHLDAKPGDMVVVEVTRWPTPARGPLGRVIEALGDIDEPGVDNEIIIRKYGIPDAHSEEAVEEARRIGSAVRDDDLRGRTDFRPLVTVTIDGEHAQRFRRRESRSRSCHTGNYWLGVSHRRRRALRPGGERARRRGVRTRHVGLLSRTVLSTCSRQKLSTGLCSLNPQVDRLVQSCLMEVESTRHGAPVRAARRRHP